MNNVIVSNLNKKLRKDYVSPSQGFNGTGVVVCVIDDGLEKDHLDLIKNYVSQLQ